MKFLASAPRFLFFTGKGGVGKTSIACASAVELASQGKRVLLVSTDPASNVGQVFSTVIGNTITPIADVANLDALEIDPDQAAEDYRARILAPIKAILSPKDLASVTEQLSGSCTTEIASFNEFTSLLTDDDRVRGYDHVVFDTAPTGHTVRLLKLPGEWTSFLDDGLGDASCLGPMSGLEKTRSTYATALNALADPELTRLVLVARPQRSPLDEAARTCAELGEAGVRATHLVVNGCMPDSETSDEFAAAIHRREHELLTHLPQPLQHLVLDIVELRPGHMVGLPALQSLLRPSEPARADVAVPTQQTEGLSSLIDELATRDRGLIMCMGKGGVGKTTMASAIALGLAQRGMDVLLTTTDPAAHLCDALGKHGERIEVSSIDPEAAVAAYRDHVMSTKGAKLDEAGRANLAEDLRSPCTEEVAVFSAFSKAVAQANRRFVVMDTAPTGHTLLLMDATGSFHRDIARNAAEGLKITTPLMRLQNPDYTKIVIVTLPETTPVLEAVELQRDLERADIHPYAWVVNQSLAGVATTSALLQARGAAETSPLDAARQAASKLFTVSMRATPPVGAEALAAL